jgi:hypothetical protein
MTLHQLFMRHDVSPSRDALSDSSRVRSGICPRPLSLYQYRARDTSGGLTESGRGLEDLDHNHGPSDVRLQLQISRSPKKLKQI